MFSPSSEKRIAALQAQPLVWLSLLGVILGLAFLVVVQLPRKWFIFLFLSSLLIPVFLSVGNRKTFLLGLLTLSVPIWIGMHIGYHKTPFGRSTFGFPIHFSFFPLVALYLTWFVNRVVWKIPSPLSTRGLPLLVCLLGAGACSVLVAKEPLFAIFDLFALATSMAIFIYVSSQVVEIKELRLVMILLAFSAFFQAILALIEKLVGVPLGMYFLGASPQLYGHAGLEAVARVGGLIGHPNSLALFFDLVLPITFSFLFYPLSRGLKSCLLGAFFIEVLGLGVTYSRGGIIASSLILFFLLIFFLTKRTGLTRAAMAALLVGTLTLALLLIVPNPLRTGLSRTEATAYGRMPLVDVALNVIRHQPLLGTGLNNFVVTARQYDYTPEQIITAWNSPVHNIFLFIGGELGLVGLTFFILFLARVMTWLYPALRSQDPLILCSGAGLFFGFLAFFIHAQVDYSIWTQNRLLWFLLGLAIVIGRFARGDAANREVAASPAAGA